MFYVYSRSLVTGKVNHCTQAFPKAEAQAYADELNADPNYKDYLILWIEAAEQCVYTDPPSALVSVADSTNTAGG